jgi:predicted nuclease of predicted toxin-antitoxin system
MKFLADINIPQSVINVLIAVGHDILDLKNVDLALPDTGVIQLAKREKRIILTKDKDFIGLTQFPKYQVPTIVIRLKIQTPQHMTRRLLEFLENQNEDILQRSLTLIKEDTADSHPYS